MLKGIRLCDTHASCVTGPREFRFQPGYNAVIGPNGSGKTQLLQVITRSKCKNCVFDRPKDRKIRFYYFDTEKDNPRTKNYFESIGQIVSRYMSHGEAMQKILAEVSVVDTDMFIIDEPESGLDFNGVLTFRKAIQSFFVGGNPEEAGRRAIIATHHPLLWFGNVIVLGDDPDYRDRCRTRFREELADE